MRGGDGERQRQRDPRNDVGDRGEQKKKIWGGTKIEIDSVIVFEPGVQLFVFLMEPLPKGV